MCGRYVSPEEAAITRAWRVGRNNSNPWRRSYNVQPTTVVPVLRLHRETGELELVSARWGLIPHWWRDAKPPTSTFNARIEEAASKPMWRDALRRARCLVPAEGWYEWQVRQVLDDATGAARPYKQPYFIHRRDRRLLCFAGLFARWDSGSTAEPLLSCTVLTTAAAGPLAAVHDRMPAVAPDEIHTAWLDAAFTDGTRAADLLLEAATVEGLECYEVSTRVNHGRLDGAELIEPFVSSPGSAGATWTRCRNTTR